MLDLASDIRSLSDFKRNTVELLDHLRKTGHPLVLTINGKAEIVVQDAAAYRCFSTAWRRSKEFSADWPT